MPCSSCGEVQVARTTGSYNNVQVLNHSDCEGITYDLIVMFLNIITCTKNSNKLQVAGISEVDADSTILLLGNWKQAKLADPASCEYQDKLPIVQNIIQKAIVTGTC